MAFYHDGYNNSGITAYDRPITARLDRPATSSRRWRSIEVADPTSVVMTLKPDMVYQNKAPVNGREVVAGDIVATQEYVSQACRTRRTANSSAHSSTAGRRRTTAR